VSASSVARKSLNAKTICGGEHKNKYLLETTRCGVAFYDYDNDGWLDIVLVNGTRLEGFPAGSEPTSDLFRNNRDGTFTDVTAKAGVAHSGWGGASFEYATFTAGLGAHTQYLGWGCGFFDMDNDGWDDILICNGHVYPEVEQLKTKAGSPGRKLLDHNLRNGHFADVSFQAGRGISEPSPSRSAAFGDFDNDVTSTSW
jgi:hypothetical protein